MELDELAVELARTDADGSTVAVSGGEADQVLIALHHRHVPALADAGLVEYDRDGESVAITDAGRSVGSWLSAGPTTGVPADSA